MSTTNPQITTITLPVAQNQSVDFAKLIKKYIFHWPLFFVALAAFITGAYFYLQYAKPIYPVNSTLEFKDDHSTTGGGSSDKTGINELDQLTPPIIVENEIEVMKSKKIMFQVVNDLKLWVNYTTKVGLIAKDLYGASPVNFEFIKQKGTIDPKGIKLLATIKDKNYFYLVNDDGTKQIDRFGQEIKSDFGTWKLEANGAIDGYYGKTIKITVSDRDAATDNYLSGLNVALENKDAPFVNLSLSEEVPQRGKDILNSIMAIYNKNAIADKNKKSQATIDFIDKRLDSISRDLISTEKMVAEFKSSHLITNIDRNNEADIDARSKNRQALTDINVQIQAVEQIENYLNSPQNQSLPATGGLADAGLNSMLDKLSDLILKKDQLLETTLKDFLRSIVSINKCSKR